MLRRPTAILFDLDGTLVDSVADLAAAANHTRVQFGLTALPEPTVRSFIGDGVGKLIERVMGDADVDRGEALKVFRAYYGEHCLVHTAPYPGVVEGLARLAGRPLAVVSNKPQPFTERVVAGLGLDGFFGCVVGARPGVPVKPAPDLLRLALEGLGVGASGVWMVGDSPNDVRGARAIGCVSVAVAYGLTDTATLRADGPDLIVDSFPGIVDAVAASERRDEP